MLIQTFFEYTPCRNEGGRVATPTSFSIFDSYNMKCLWFKFGMPHIGILLYKTRFSILFCTWLYLVSQLSAQFCRRPYHKLRQFCWLDIGIQYFMEFFGILLIPCQLWAEDWRLLHTTPKKSSVWNIWPSQCTAISKFSWSKFFWQSWRILLNLHFLSDFLPW